MLKRQILVRQVETLTHAQNLSSLLLRASTSSAISSVSSQRSSNIRKHMHDVRVQRRERGATSHVHHLPVYISLCVCMYKENFIFLHLFNSKTVSLHPSAADCPCRQPQAARRLPAQPTWACWVAIEKAKGLLPLS